jgi:hypothetical protein
MKCFRITNTSDWSTNDVRAIVKAACEAAGMTGIPRVTVGRTGRRAHKFITDSPEHILRHRIRGWAYVQSPAVPGRIKMLLPDVDQVPPELRDLFRRHVAQVAHHEALHSVGAHHKDMTDAQRWCYQDVPWVEAMPLRAKSELRPPKPEVPREERRAADQVERLEHVRAMHKKSLTRVKRAQTFEKKWRRRLRALEKKSS